MPIPTLPRALVALPLLAVAAAVLAVTASGDHGRAQPIAGRASPIARAVPASAGLKVVELFQSQGCSSCPPANANVNALAARPDVLALSYGVTYWDRLGWTDTFASPENTARQWRYARSRGRGRVWTPQVYVNGREDLVGANGAALAAAVGRARPLPPIVRVAAGWVGVGRAAAPPGGAEILLVRYDPRTVPVPIRAGENGGRTLPHRNVVRELKVVGRWTGAPVSAALPASPRPGLATAVLVQAPGGPVLAAAKEKSGRL